VVDRFEEPTEDQPILKLFCSIVVERESQKAIVIGRGGAMIKQIGTAARLELERFFSTKVYLDLHARVNPEWRENDQVLHDIGLDGRVEG
jgi:GTP-binding protein Era